MFAATILSVTLQSFATQGIDPSLASRFFQEAEWASKDDNGKLWGKKLYGPTLLVDRYNGDAIGNQPDKDGNLKAHGGVFVGKVPNSFAAANTAKEWAGVKWSVILWPLPTTTTARTSLIMHESWHRIQDDIGLKSTMNDNDHLDSKDGRTWLLLEYRALAKALPALGDERKNALQDALTFRQYRRRFFPSAAATEDRMEVHEGLAEYTGLTCSGMSNEEARFFLASRLKLNAHKDSLTYSFAYETGAAYGLMLDQYSETWRKGLTTSSSLSSMLAKLAKVGTGKPTPQEALNRAKAYDGEAIIKAEITREVNRKKKETEYRRLLVDGPRIHVPFGGNFSFNPNSVFPIKGIGIVYTGCKLTGDWGTLQVDGPVLISPDYQDAWITAGPASDPTKGQSWKLMLSKNWKIVTGRHSGDFDLVKGT